MDRSFLELGSGAEIPTGNIYFADYLTEEWGEFQCDLLRWLIVHVINQSTEGFICTDLSRIGEEFLVWRESRAESAWIEGLRRTLAVHYRDMVTRNPRLFAKDAARKTPFIVAGPEGSYVYLLQNYRKESVFLASLIARIDHTPPLWEIATKETVHPERAQRAISLVTSGALTIINGAPGTGKTTLIVQIVRHSIAAMPGGMRIVLAAPTGRAAQRMMEGFREERANHSSSDDALLPARAQTLHALLTRRGAKNPLTADLVVVDEASMIDLDLMNRLLESLPLGTRLLLVGDRNQLPPVGRGQLFSDMLEGIEGKEHKLHGRVLSLTTVYRSAAPFVTLARHVVRGEGSLVLEALKGTDHPGIIWESLPSEEALVETLFRESPQEEKKTARETLLAHHSSHLILTPLRKGPYGVERLNRHLDLLRGRGIKGPYHGQPIMVTRNNYRDNLANGERGVVVKEGGGWVVLFPREGDPPYRVIPLSSLGEYEIAHVQTIHKSQGSEADRLTLIMPEGAERLITREVFYTGLTRARKEVRLLGEETTLLKAIASPIARHSRVREVLLADQREGSTL